MKDKIQAAIHGLKSALPSWHFAQYGRTVDGCDGFVACYPPDRKTLAIDGSHNQEAVKALGYRISSVSGPLFVVAVRCD